MGILNFWKKKDSDIPMIGSPDGLPPLDGLPSDLPPIDGSMADGNNAQSMQGNDGQDSGDGHKSLSVNMPILDFSMPPSDDEQLPTQQNVAPQAQPSENSDLLAPPSPVTQQTESLSVDDLNNLFVSDETWKEPDWNSYDPYTEEKIEEPLPEDFGDKTLPKFEDINAPTDFTSGSDSMSGPMIADEPVVEPAAPFADRPKSESNPVELFIRGKAYSRVFVELDQMNKTLAKLDSQVGNYEELLRKEEPMVLMAKDQVEYLYRKINQIDKKVFVQ